MAKIAAEDVGKRSKNEKRRQLWLSIKQNKECYLMIAPFMLFFIIFTIVPVVMSLPMGFTDFNMVQPPDFNGIRNYVRLFLEDDIFKIALKNTLFFALPAEASYAHPGEDRPVCASGVYALCRHPGVLWFAGAYLCLWGGCGFPLWAAVLYTVLDVLLVVFEDGWVFPARLSGYDDYRRTTPFLLPNRSSLRALFARS